MVVKMLETRLVSWWRNQVEASSALLAICAGNSPVTGEFPAQRPVTRSLDAFLDLRLNKSLSKQWWGWLLETLSRPLWRRGNVCLRPRLWSTCLLCNTYLNRLDLVYSQITTPFKKKIDQIFFVCENMPTQTSETISFWSKRANTFMFFL